MLQKIKPEILNIEGISEFKADFLEISQSGKLTFSKRDLKSVTVDLDNMTVLSSLKFTIPEDDMIFDFAADDEKQVLLSRKQIQMYLGAN